MAIVCLILIACIRQCFSIAMTQMRQGLDGRYIWPSGRGRIEHYSSSPFVAPRNLSGSLAWTWHDPVARYANVPNAVNIDDTMNIYLTSLDGIRKFTPNGELLWAYTPHREVGEEMPDTASLYKGAVFVSTTAGRIVAVSMRTGEELWKTKLASTDGNNGWVSVHEDTVITGSDANDLNRGESTGRRADTRVTGLNASDGSVRWTFEPEAPVWNFLASFANDGTFTFQDYEGRAYRNRVSDGTLIWKSGGLVGSWTDGSSLLGPNRVVYAVGNYPGMAYPGDGPSNPGVISAYRLEDGELLWRTIVPRAPNEQPAIGHLAGYEGLSLVQPIGQQCHQGFPTDVYALDAETGRVRWIFNGPNQKEELQAGDSNLLAQFQRASAGVRRITLPNPWSAPSIDASGTVFIGSEEGPFYALQDANSDGLVKGAAEVSTLDTKACFSGSSSPAIAPGMVVVASIDAMYVFKQ